MSTLAAVEPLADEHAFGCVAYALECFEQSAVDDGRTPNDWGYLLEDPSPWGGETVEDVLRVWYADGTYTCQCPETRQTSAYSRVWAYEATS